jgi:hypothetical protein
MHGILEYWNTGILEYWNDGTMKYFSSAKYLYSTFQYSSSLIFIVLF